MSGQQLATQTVELQEAAALSEKLLRLQESLQQGNPGYDSQLFTIHQQLSKQPDLVHLLKPEQIAVIVAGLEKKTGLMITMETSKSKKPAKISMDDI